MTAVEIIMTALVSGAAAGVKDVATNAVKEGVAKLKSLVQRRMNEQDDAAASELALARYETEPDVWEAPLKAALVRSGAADDAEIIGAAQQVLALINPQQAAMGKYNVQITGAVQGFVQGDNANVSMSFGDKPPTPEASSAPDEHGNG